MSGEQFELPDDAAVDFREPAVRESLRIVQANRGIVPADRSLCLPAPDAETASLRGLGLGVVLMLILGFAAILGGCALGVASRNPRPNDAQASWRMALALCGTVGGIALLLGSGSFQRRFTRRRLGERYEDLAAVNARPVWVGIEEALTFHRFKLVPEDVGFAAFDPAARRVVIEGVLHRYVIRGDDVLSLGQLPGGASTATAIAYQVGDAQLAITLQSNSLWHELKRQTTGAKRDPLLRRIQETLGATDHGAT